MKNILKIPSPVVCPNCGKKTFITKDYNFCYKCGFNFKKKETVISDFSKLEKRVAEIERIVPLLTESINSKLFFNSVMKEEYNFQLLSYLFDKFEIEKPESKYKI